MAVYQELHDGTDDGARLGNATTQKVGFFGATPVERPTTATAVASTAITAVTSTAITSVATTAATSGTTNNALFGFTTSTQADAIVTAVNALITRVASAVTAVNDTNTRANASVTAVNTIKSNLDTLGLQG